MTIKDYIKENRLITDGAMGTYFEAINTTEMDVEEANIKEPQMIINIHKAYIDAGAKLIRTNSFNVGEIIMNQLYHKEGDLTDADETYDINEYVDRVCDIARSAIGQKQVFIGADIGTIIYNYDVPREEVLAGYKKVCDRFIENNVDAFVFETQVETEFINDIAKYIKSKTDTFVIAQFSFDKTGYTKSGLSIKSMVRQMEESEYVDAYGFNCGMPSSHLYDAVKKVQFSGKKIITALPNASYTNIVRGKVLYSSNIPYYAEMMDKIDSLGVRILGGCCGTTPEYIESLVDKLKDKNVTSIENQEYIDKTTDVIQEVNPLMEKFDSGKKVIMVELDPPFDDDIDKVFEGAHFLKGKGCDVVTMSDSPLGRARMESALLSVTIQDKTGMTVMPHISCRDRNSISLRGMLLGLNMQGVRNILVVTGDPALYGENVKQVYEFNSIKLMNYISKMNEEVFDGHRFMIAGALNHNGVNKDAIANRMKSKMDAGAALFLTQPVYSDEDVERLEYLKKETGARILAGIMPLVSHKNAVFIKNEMPGINVPDSIIERYKEGLTREQYEDIAVEISLSMISKLDGIVDGYYFMPPFNRFKLIQRIIDEAGIAK